MELIYNVDFCVATMILDAILYLYLCSQRGNSNTDNLFRSVVFLAFLCSTMDYVTSVTITYGMVVPSIVNYILNSVMFFSCSLLGLYLSFYVMRYIESKKNVHIKHQILLGIPILVHLIMLIVNMVNPILFLVDGTIYEHGPLYVINSIVPAIYILFIMFVFFKNGNAFEAPHRLAITVLFISGVTAAAVQFLFLPSVLILNFAISVCLIPVWFTMETPDYRKMIDAMDKLEKEKVKANAANKAKSDFLANMSHEIRTPINTVLGMNEMILRESSDSNINYYASNIKSSGQALLILINDILDISKIEAGKMELTIAEYELSSLINDSFSMVSGRLKDADLEMVLKIDENIPDLLIGDMARLRQVIVNLINNAIKHTKRGFIILEMDGVRHQDDIELIIKVKDTGQGILMEEKVQAYKNYREDSDSSAISDGAGLGLNVTIDLINLMGGDFDVETLPEVGTTFTVHITQAIKDETPIGKIKLGEINTNPQVDDESAAFFANGSRILVVDDVEANRTIVGLLLKKSNLIIDMAGNGETAVKMATETHYDCILMDHMMPGMDGVDTFKAIRNIPDGINENTPVVMVTANAIVGVRDKFLAEGFNDYLTKPIKARDLENVLKKYIPKTDKL